MKKREDRREKISGLVKLCSPRAGLLYRAQISPSARRGAGALGSALAIYFVLGFRRKLSFFLDAKQGARGTVPAANLLEILYLTSIFTVYSSQRIGEK